MKNLYTIHHRPVLTTPLHNEWRAFEPISSSMFRIIFKVTEI